VFDIESKKPVAKVRKSSRKGAFDDNRQLMQLARLSSREAIEGSLASGVAVFYIKNGNLIKEGPDHKPVIIKATEKRPFNLREYLCHG